MLHMLQVFQMNVANVCSKYFICFRHMFASILIWILHMFWLQEYVLNDVYMFLFYVAASVLYYKL
jgi:hypothetical protein